MNSLNAALGLARELRWRDSSSLQESVRSEIDNVLSSRLPVSSYLVFATKLESYICRNVLLRILQRFAHMKSFEFNREECYIN